MSLAVLSVPPIPLSSLPVLGYRRGRRRRRGPHRWLRLGSGPRRGTKNAPWSPGRDRGPVVSPKLLILPGIVVRGPEGEPSVH
ncbi:Immunoglobulin Superfamily Member 22 [Manis pentadactyla]|nr:Immunoglobulin Superfamily Member 22 [Manis pentadactyla]